MTSKLLHTKRILDVFQVREPYVLNMFATSKIGTYMKSNWIRVRLKDNIL